MRSHWDEFKESINRAVRLLGLNGLDKFKVDFIDEKAFFKYMLDIENPIIFEEMCLNRRMGEGLHPAFIDLIGYFSKMSENFFRVYTSRAKAENPSIRIISHRLNPKGDNRDMKSLLFLRKLQNMNINIRVNTIVHTRLFVYYLKQGEEILPFEGRLLLGTFDFNKEGYGRGERIDAGIKTSNPDLTNSAVNHFNSIWNDTYTKPLDGQYPPDRFP